MNASTQHMANSIALRRTPGRCVLLVVACLSIGAVAAGCAHQAAIPGDSTFEARRQLARELVNRGDWENAFSYVDQLHRERARDADILVMRATIYRERRLLSEAEADLREAIALAPELGAARAALGILCELQRRTDEAEEQHRMAVKIEPRNSSYLNNLGFSLFLHGKVKESISFYEQAARLSPASRRTRTNLGFAYAARGELHKAAREFEMGGTPAEAKVNLGFAYERRGDMANAYALYVEAVKLDPKSKRARSDLSHAAEILGRPGPEALPSEASPVEAKPVEDHSAAVSQADSQPHEGPVTAAGGTP